MARNPSLFHHTASVFVPERQHTAFGVFYDEDFGGAEELLGYDYGAQGVTSGAAGVANDMGVAEGDAVCGGRVNTSVHAGH